MKFVNICQFIHGLIWFDFDDNQLFKFVKVVKFNLSLINTLHYFCFSYYFLLRHFLFYFIDVK